MLVVIRELNKLTSHIISELCKWSVVWFLTPDLVKAGKELTKNEVR